ncbi:PHD finger protein 7-like [Pipra filicauda]|uniref:PHD finger protein 7-like n=1 Tax=Pipra filicauda TaxID=649802 RepID=A0A7R5L5Y1_9PASS|nr:PHD finger protein 7-like [Pipra filicauda]
MADRHEQAPEEREQTPKERQEAPEQREDQAPEERQEAPEDREPACLLCQPSEADPDICGQKSFIFGLCVHKFCLFFVSNSPDIPVQRLEDWNIGTREIPDIVSQAAQQSCCICGQGGATIPCWARHCDLSFHLPCAKQGGCVTQFMPPYRAFCPAHSPQQAVWATPEPGTQCLICLEPVEDRMTFNTLVCPACRTAWFHRDCIQSPGQEPCASTKSWEAQAQAETLKDIPQGKSLLPATSDPKSIRPVQKSP